MASVEIFQDISQIGEARWEAARDNDYPFLRYAFLCALETSGSVCPDTGWTPFHILLSDETAPADDHQKSAFIPMYIKSHSYGEYVFDWAWANAYERYHLDYYPKLLCAVPFTPATGPRALPHANEQWAFDLFIAAAPQLLEEFQLSSFHLLFPKAHINSPNQSFMRRIDTQFHWFNKQYTSFDDFLAGFSSRHRKSIKKERTKVLAQGVRFETLSGTEINTSQLKSFYTFYHATYMKRGNRGYLNYDFFQKLVSTMPEQMVFIFALVAGEPVAAALCFQDSSTLYGRYWGCLDEYDSLHFETCYYQGIEYCIRKSLQRFDPGAQGEHKIKRGFEPTETHSFHWIQEPGFIEPIRNFLRDEHDTVENYREEQIKRLPFKAS